MVISWYLIEEFVVNNSYVLGKLFPNDDLLDIQLPTKKITETNGVIVKL